MLTDRSEYEFGSLIDGQETGISLDEIFALHSLNMSVIQEDQCSSNVHCLYYDFGDEVKHSFTYYEEEQEDSLEEEIQE